jgi:hypothetical protein
MRKILLYIYDNVSLKFSFSLYFICIIVLSAIRITLKGTKSDALQTIISDINLFLTYIFIFFILCILVMFITGPFLNIDFSKKRVYFNLEEHRFFLYIRFFVEYLILLANIFYFIINIVLLFYIFIKSTLHVILQLIFLLSYSSLLLYLFIKLLLFIRHYILVVKNTSNEKLNTEFDITMAIISIISIMISSGFEINKFVSKSFSKDINSQLDFTSLFIILTPILFIMYILKLFIIFREQIIKFIKDIMNFKM